jgi:hypothetical protein
MAFSDMNDVEQELGEEKPPERNGNRTFLIIAGALGGIMVLALLCIAGLALYRYLPSQQAAVDQNATKAAQDTAAVLSVSETASVPTLTATKLPTLQPTFTPTKTKAPTNTPVLVIIPTKSPTVDVAIVTQYALLTQTAEHILVTTTPSGAPTESTTPLPTSAATTSANSTSAAATSAKSTSAAATSVKSTSAAATSVKSTSAAATTAKPTSTVASTTHPTSTALPATGIADELGTPGLLAAAFVLIVIIFIVRGLRTAS